MLALKFWSHLHCHPINKKPFFSFTDVALKSIANANVCRLNSSSSASSYSAMTVQQTQNFSPLTGLESDLVGYVFGKKKATEVAHFNVPFDSSTVQVSVCHLPTWPHGTENRIWKHVLQKGDTVVDATCGNGYDTLALLNMVADESGSGCVYGLDIQGEALESTYSLLQETVNQAQKQLVKLFNICHSKMEEVVPIDTPVRLVAFNLGYLPGGDKSLITTSETTLLALEAAERVLIPGGLISLVVYVGHPGGREELETVEAFASRLSVDRWTCCKFQMLNRPLAPVLVFLFKRC